MKEKKLVNVKGAFKADPKTLVSKAKKGKTAKTTKEVVKNILKK